MLVFQSISPKEFLVKQFTFCLRILKTREFLIREYSIVFLTRNYPKTYIKLLYLLYLIRVLTIVILYEDFYRKNVPLGFSQLVNIFNQLEYDFNSCFFSLKECNKLTLSSFSYGLDLSIINILMLFKQLDFDYDYISFDDSLSIVRSQSYFIANFVSVVNRFREKFLSSGFIYDNLLNINWDFWSRDFSLVYENFNSHKKFLDFPY